MQNISYLSIPSALQKRKRESTSAEEEDEACCRDGAAL